MRTLLCEGARSVVTRSVKRPWLKAWAVKIAWNRGLKRTIAALARRLAAIVHRIWAGGTEFRWMKGEAASALWRYRLQTGVEAKFRFPPSGGRCPSRDGG